MHVFERVLQERADQLAERVVKEAGLTPREARLFVERAGSDLLASYRWQAHTLSELDISSPDLVRSLLSAARAKWIATEVGLSQRRAWDGLRTLVPAVVQDAAGRSPGH
ncbi:MAG: hypothetical protein OEN56_05375 [Gemmatimonadota bacterium]|nr:hypothetical protein [Gemmatimonadota bacterium]